jgi:sulfoxide reductase heme-binding subunit YedZ
LNAPRARLWLLRAAVWATGLLPLASVGLRAVHGRLTANPVEFLEHFTGDWTLRLLLLTLAMTPLRRISGLPEFIRVRRTIGLWAYAYLCLHFSIYLVFDLGFSPVQLGEDLAKRSYILLGFAALLCLTPLALTSTHGWQRRLGRRWKTLHRLVYPAAVLGSVHYLWLVKADIREPLVYAAILAALLLSRVPVKGVWRAPPRAASVSAGETAPPAK